MAQIVVRRSRSGRRGVARLSTCGVHPDDIITLFEVRMGLELLATGRRRRALEDAFAKMIGEDFEERVIPFDAPAAHAAGRSAAERRRSGRSVETRDVQIAGIALARKAALT